MSPPGLGWDLKEVSGSPMARSPEARSLGVLGEAGDAESADAPPPPWLNLTTLQDKPKPTRTLSAICTGSQASQRAEAGNLSGEPQEAVS